MVGTVVEWYEFFLYATAASLVFGKFFFPNAGSELDGIIAAFLTYAVGFIARPLGGIVFGQIGDRLGRKHTLQVTIILVGAATFLMGCLPGYNTIGYWAPALLVALRFIQGFAVGGEWGGAVLLVAERRSRITEAQATRFLDLLTQLPIRVDSTPVDSGAVIAAGRRHGLSAYDAAVLVADQATATFYETVARGRDPKLAAAPVGAEPELEFGPVLRGRPSAAGGARP